MNELQEKLLQTCHDLSFAREHLAEAHKTACFENGLVQLLLFPLVGKIIELRNEMNRIRQAYEEEMKNDTAERINRGM